MANDTAPTENNGVSVGRTLSRAFGAIGANPLVMLGVAFLLGALPSALVTYGAESYFAALPGQPNAIRNTAFLSVAVFLVMLIATMTAQGALIRASGAYAEGRSASFGESVAAGLRATFPLIGLAIIFIFAIMLGLVLLIIPAIILYTIWSVASPALVEERVGVFGALGRSAELTKGARWKVFGFNLVVLIAIWVASAILGALELAMSGELTGDTAGSSSSPTLLIANAVTTTFVTAFWAAAQTSLFVELREWKDGPQTEHLSEVFA